MASSRGPRILLSAQRESKERRGLSTQSPYGSLGCVGWGTGVGIASRLLARKQNLPLETSTHPPTSPSRTKLLAPTRGVEVILNGTERTADRGSFLALGTGTYRAVGPKPPRVIGAGTPTTALRERACRRRRLATLDVTSP